MTPAWPRAWWTLGGVVLGAVTAASLTPLPADFTRTPVEDWVFHVVAWTAVSGGFAPLHRRVLIVAVGLFLYSLALEGVQALLPHRVGEWGDVLAKGVGVMIGTALGRRWGGDWVRYSEGRVRALMAWMRSDRRA